MKTCSICSELLCADNSRFSRIFSTAGFLNAVMDTTEKYAVIPSIGPLVYGHCLIATRKHCSSLLSRIESENDERQLKYLLHKILAKFDFEGEKVLFCFEHGANVCFTRELCSTTHAHLHAVPRDQALATDILQKENSHFDSSSVGDASSLAKNFNEYLVWFVLDSKGVAKVKIRDAEKLPTQYLRKIICNSISSSEWDWKKHPRKDLIEVTMRNHFRFNINVSSESSSVIVK